MSQRSASPPPIRLANRFFHIIDFHADPLTCISASTGTVSYDSVLTANAINKNEVPRAFRQPPRPHGVVKARNQRKGRAPLVKTPVDAQMFRKIRKEELKRNKQVTTERRTLPDWAHVKKEVVGKMRDALTNFHKDPCDPSRRPVYDVTIELPIRNRRGVVPEFRVTSRTLSAGIHERLPDNETTDARRKVETVYKSCRETFTM